MNRREFGRLAMAGTFAGGTDAAPARQDFDPFSGGLRIGTRFNPQPSAEDFAFMRQSGAEFASVWTTIENSNYDYMINMRKRLEEHGIGLFNIGILDLHCDPALVLATPERDRKVEQYKNYLRALGHAGIRYTTYAHMANIKMAPYYQTAQATTRGVPTREFDMEAAKRLPLSHGRVYTEDEIWNSFTTFIRAVMPVAEKAGVRIGLHPDDPPVPSLGGVARVFRNFEGYRRALEIADSENFGLCLCVGSWAEGGKATGKDVFEMIRNFGPKGRIFKIHFRNVSAPLPKFHETFVDDGYIDMEAVARTLREVNFRGVLIPDHVPGEGLRGPGTAYTLGYMRSARERANG